jgi:rhomboid protease GluP
MRTTQLILVVNVLLYAVMVAVGGSAEIAHFSSGTMLKLGASYAPWVERGEWWRLVTCIFLHFDPIHLLMNSVALYQAGALLEPRVGGMRFLGIYLVAGLGGSLASLAWHWRSAVVSAGASGAVCGIVAAGALAMHLVGARRERDSMLRWILIIIVYGFAANVDAAAHAGGLIVGAGAMRLFGERGEARAERANAGPGLEAFLLLAVVGGAFLFAGRAWQRDQVVRKAVDAGIELAKQSKHDEAIAQYRRAIALDPNEPTAHYDLAISLVHKGERAAALESARIAARLDPDNKKARDFVQHLENGDFDTPPD